MNLVKEAIDLGFSNAAVMDTKKLVFVPEYRNFCEENRCGCYNLNPACPPSCGTAEEMKQRAFRYKNTLVLQTTLEDSRDPAQYKKDKLRHNIMTEKLAGKMEAEGITDILIMTAGPYNTIPVCRHTVWMRRKWQMQPGCSAGQMTEWCGYFSQILFHE